jgi:hypothetical protein
MVVFGRHVSGRALYHLKPAETVLIIHEYCSRPEVDMPLFMKSKVFDAHYYKNVHNQMSYVRLKPEA